SGRKILAAHRSSWNTRDRRYRAWTPCGFLLDSLPLPITPRTRKSHIGGEVRPNGQTLSVYTPDSTAQPLASVCEHGTGGRLEIAGFRGARQRGLRRRCGVLGHVGVRMPARDAL